MESEFKGFVEATLGDCKVNLFAETLEDGRRVYLLDVYIDDELVEKMSFTECGDVAFEPDFEV